MNQYDKNEKKALDKERQIFDYMHSKRIIKKNPWKYSNHIIEEFSRPKIDEIYKPRVEIKRKYDYTTEPFYRPKEKGDYFDKHIGII